MSLLWSSQSINPLPHPPSLERGVLFLISGQQTAGGWNLLTGIKSALTHLRDSFLLIVLLVLWPFSSLEDCGRKEGWRKGWRVLGLIVLGQTFGSRCNVKLDIMAENLWICRTSKICWLWLLVLSFQKKSVPLCLLLWNNSGVKMLTTSFIPANTVPAKSQWPDAYLPCSQLPEFTMFFRSVSTWVYHLSSRLIVYELCPPPLRNEVREPRKEQWVWQ